MPDRLLTPSKITAWLDCAHFLTLRHEVEAGTRTVESSPFGEMAQMLLDKGMEHEQAVLERYRDDGLSVFEVPDRRQYESFRGWVDRVGDVLAEGHDVVFQMPFVHEGIRGIADFLVRVDHPETGTFSYEPVDAKLARREAKPGHVLQLCFYAEAIEASTGVLPEFVSIELGSGLSEQVRVADVLPYWRRMRSQLATLLADEAVADTRPKPCDHCQFCEFELVCDAQWREADSLVHVAGVRTVDRLALQRNGVTTIAGLAAVDGPVGDLDEARLDTFVRQARLQVEARNAPDDKPPFELLDPLSGAEPAGDDRDTPDPIGFAALPAPDDGDVFLDFEGHPFWHADAELFFLFGLIERSSAGEWEFKAFWAHDKAEEADATKALIDHLAARRVEFPDMHVYHYNHTERSSLERLVREHAVAELALEQLISTGQFVDLLPIVKGAMQVGVEGYGLKHIERLTGYERGHEIDKGAGAVVEYERWMGSRDDASLAMIAAYNEDDVRATRALRDWLVTQRPDDVEWRSPVLGREEPDADLDERIEALHAFGLGTDEHLMGDLLGYWRRERQVVSADAYRLSIAPEADQFESLSAITRLTFRGLEPQISAKTGKPLKWPWARFTFPPQPIDVDIRKGSKLIVALNEQEWLFFKLEQIDAAAGELWVTWDGDAEAAGVHPSSLVHYVWFQEGAKLKALEELADDMLAGRGDKVAHAMLRRDAPAFLPGSGPAGGEFVGDVPAICAWSTGLDRSYVPIQGPPGTGKTYTGAKVIHTLVTAGLRVGITAMSHAAIDNLMQAVVDRFKEEGDSGKLRAVRKAKEGSVRGIRYVDDNASVARSGLQRGRRNDVAVREQADARDLGRRAGRRRGGPARSCRHVGGDDLGDQRDPARRSAAVAAGVAGEPPGWCRCECAGASARRRHHGAGRPWCAVGDHVADASRRVRVHLRRDVRRQAAQPSELCRPVGGGLDRPALASCRPQGPLDRVARGGCDRGRQGARAARAAVDRSARCHSPADDARLHGGRAVQRPAPVHHRGVAGRSGDAECRGRHGRQVPGSRGGRRVVLDGDVVGRAHATHRRLPVLEEPAERGDQPGAMSGLPGVHRRTARHTGPRRRGDVADLRAVLVRRAVSLRSGLGDLRVP